MPLIEDTFRLNFPLNSLPTSGTVQKEATIPLLLVEDVNQVIFYFRSHSTDKE